MILASSVAVNLFSAKASGHMAPWSRFAESLKPNVEIRLLHRGDLRLKSEGWVLR
jgi:hypothetical protein